MDTYTLPIPNAETQLLEIKSALIVLHYIFYGFNRLDYIDNSELAGFEHLLEEAREKVNNLLLSLQPVDMSGEE